MRRWSLFFILAAVLVCLVCAAGAEPVKVTSFEPADLRSSAGGKITAKIYDGVPAERLETKGKWSRIRIGEDTASLTGWMLSEDLLPLEEGEWLYPGQDCIPAQGHAVVPLLSAARKDALIEDVWDGTDDDSTLTVAGITRDNAWLLVARTGDDNVPKWYYAAADSLSGFDSAYVISRAADTVVSLREAPNTKAKILGSYFGGVHADILFDFEQASGWTRIGIGGVAGFMMNDFLMEAEFDVPPYRPPLSPLAGQSAAVYAASSGKDPLAGEGGDLLTDREFFIVLGRGKTRYHIRINTAEPGEYRYGWIDHQALKTQDLVAGSTKALLTRDTVVYGWNDQELGSLEAGQTVTLRWFYSSFAPDDDTPVLDYYDPKTSAWVWIDAEDYSFSLDEWGNGFVPVDAVQVDPYLAVPEPMEIG